MTISPEDLEQIAHLSYLDTNLEQIPQLIQEINDIMDLVDQLRSVDTNGVEPLFHPLELHQRLRPDTITEKECLAELEAIAPLFKDNLYLVPQVIEQAK